MKDVRLPVWSRAVVLVAALAQTLFGLAVLCDPANAAWLWPWALPPLTARLLGATALAALPLWLMISGSGLYRAAMIPLAMLLAQTLVQIAAGLRHAGELEPSTSTLAVFGGALVMALVLGVTLLSGMQKARSAVVGSARDTAPWEPEDGIRDALRAAAGVYLILGLAFLFAGKEAGFLWMDRAGIAPLTARFFSSPMLAVAIGLFLVSRATERRSVLGPAMALLAIGPTANAAMILSHASFAPNTPAAWLVAITPTVLFGIGVLILVAPRKRPDEDDEEEDEDDRHSF